MQVMQTKVHFFSFLEVNIQLQIAQDNICFFQSFNTTLFGLIVIISSVQLFTLTMLIQS